MDVVSLVTSAFCHTLPERTYVVGGHALPLCARCTGVYVGLALAYAWALATPLRRAEPLPRRALWFCIGVIFVFALLGFGRLYDVVELGLRARTTLGLYFGVTLGVMIWPVIANWFGGVARLAPWGRAQWNSFVLLLALLPGVTLLIATPVPSLRRATGWISLAGLLVSWILANGLVLLWMFRRHRVWTLTSRLLTLLIAVACFAGEVALLRWWRTFWSV